MTTKKNKSISFAKLKSEYGSSCMSTWKDCSLDSENGISIIDCEKEIIDFDQVKTQYLNKLHVSEECSPSVDAIGVDEEGCVNMIEFKNGDFNGEELKNKLLAVF